MKFSGKHILISLSTLLLLGAAVFFVYQKSFKSKLPLIEPALIQSAMRVVPVLIIGSGPAGLSAALYTARFNLHTIVCEGRKPGGQLMSTSDVENWPGMGRALGPHIIEKLRYQAIQFGAIIIPATVEVIKPDRWPYQVAFSDGTTVSALTIILAMGASPVKLGVPGEQEYWGKGVTSCAVCDAPFFQDKDVAVVGGGDAAAEEALQLTSYARSIRIFVRGTTMRASYAMQQRLKAYEKITIHYETTVKQIIGAHDHVTGLVVVSPVGEQKIAVDGVFLAIGHTPNNALVSSFLECDKAGYVKVKPYCQKTSLPGIFSAGDLSDHFYRQAGIASGDGIKAAIDAANFLRHADLNDAQLLQYKELFFDPSIYKNYQAHEADFDPHQVEVIATAQLFDKLLEESTKPVVVLCSTEQCPSCKMLLPHLAAACRELKDRISFVKVDGGDLMPLMERYSVSSFPTVLVFKEGLLVARASSLLTRRDVDLFIAQFVG